MWRELGESVSWLAPTGTVDANHGSHSRCRSPLRHRSSPRFRTRPHDPLARIDHDLAFGRWFGRLRQAKSPRDAGAFGGGTRVEGLEPSTAGFVDRKQRFLPYLVPDFDHPFHTLRREEYSGSVADNRSSGQIGGPAREVLGLSFSETAVPRSWLDSFSQHASTGVVISTGVGRNHATSRSVAQLFI